MISLEKIDNSNVEIILDDVIKNGSNWVFETHYSSKEYEAKKLKELDFTEKELADFGYAIISRLYAYNEVGQ